MLLPYVWCSSCIVAGVFLRNDQSGALFPQLAHCVAVESVTDQIESRGIAEGRRSNGPQ